MSVSTNANTDRSTENANWGTLVVLLILVITAAVIGVALYSDHQKPVTPITLTAPAATPSAAGTTAPDAAGGPAGTNSASPSAPVSGGAGGGQ